ncbi:hypothetical protein CRE_14194 [Caenorhabditis remanei]|uniref:BZIP domain-containing protein n=1 Tax=Caenorhabditis remanei TaxID=31234 RepID=E3N1L0_CAERE|nr:hypothetical protein CRE_14194 [Caenorhabditis remanei]
MAHHTTQCNVLQRNIAVDNAAPMRDFDQQKIINMDDPHINDIRMNDDPFQGQAYPVWNQHQQNMQMENLNIDQHYVSRGRSFQDISYEHAHMAKDLKYSEMPIGYDQLQDQVIPNVYSNDQYSDHNTFQSLNSSHDFNNRSSSEDGSFDEIVQEKAKNSYEQHLSGKLSEEPVSSSPQQDSDEDYEPEQKQDLSQEKMRRSDIKTRTSKRVRVADPDYNEDSDEDDEEQEDIKPDKKELQKQMQRSNWKPQTVARPYSLKKAKDREDPLYQLRRAKNNDSVRKSRNKKKEEELAREEKYEKIEDENFELKRRVAELEKKLENCRCQKETARKPGKRS